MKLIESLPTKRMLFMLMFIGLVFIQYGLFLEAECLSVPPDLTVFNPEIDGLTVSVNGVVLPGTPSTTITRIHCDSKEV